MVKSMPLQVEPLEKSSKGTLIRSKVEARFAQDIEKAHMERETELIDDVSNDRVE